MFNTENYAELTARELRGIVDSVQLKKETGSGIGKYLDSFSSSLATEYGTELVEKSRNLLIFVDTFVMIILWIQNGKG